MKVIISTFGPLHLVKSAEYLSKLVDVRVIQGYIPRWWNRWLLYILGKIMKRNMYIAFQKRTPSKLEGKNFSVSLPEFLRFFTHYFRIENKYNLGFYTHVLYGALSKRYLENADVLHVRSGSGLGGAIEKAHSKGMKVLVDHSIAHPSYMDKQLRNEYIRNGAVFDMGLDNSRWQGILSDCLRADLLLVNSQFVKKTFCDNGYREDKIRVVYLGVRNDFFNLKKSYELRDGILKILFTGGFGFRKGAEYILKALCKLDELRFPYQMIVVGDYSDSKDLLNKYAPKNITLVGVVPQNNLKEYLESSDIYLFPSLCEGCASSGMEAMAAGLPVISTKESGLPIIHGENGYIVKSKDVDSVIFAIKQLYEEVKMRELMGKNAAKIISENYTWEKYAKRVCNVYNELLKMPRSY